MSTSEEWPRPYTPEEQRQREEAREAHVAKIERDMEAEKGTPAGEFRAAIESARRRFLSGPLDIVAELVERAADCAEKIGDPRTPKLKELANQLDDVLADYDKVERKLWALFGEETNAMEPAPGGNDDVTFDE